MLELPENNDQGINMNKALSKQQCEQVLTALDQILSSKPFAKAKKQQALLSYIVHAAINGQDEKINGYNIAVEVFERAEDFDPQTDTIVRVAVGRLRTKLKTYYQELATAPEVTIELPIRSYIPKITFNHITNQQHEKQQKTLPETTKIPEKPSAECQRRTQIKRLIFSTTRNLALIIMVVTYINLTQSTCSSKKQSTETIAHSEAQIQRMEAQLAHESLKLATQYYAQENYLDAASHYQKAANTAAQNSETWRLLGHTHLILAQYPDAKHAFEQALAIDQNSPQSQHFVSQDLTYIGHHHRKTRQYQKAIEHYQKILDSHQPTHELSADIYRGIALAHSFLAQHPQASYAMTTAFQQFELTARKDQQLLLKLHSARGIIKKRQGQHLEAIVDFVTAKELASQQFGDNHSQVAEQRALLAMMYSRTNQYQQAVDEYVQAIKVIKSVYGEQHSKVARLFNNITNPLIKQQRFQQAADYLQKALVINSQSVDQYPISYALNLYNLGLVHQSLQQHQSALNYLQQSLTFYIEAFGQNHPEVGEIWQVMAQVANQMEDNDNARYYYRQALKAFESSDAPMLEPLQEKVQNIKLQLQALDDS